MKKTVFAATAAIALMAALPAAAQGWYAQVNAGTNVADDIDGHIVVDDTTTVQNPDGEGKLGVDLNNGFDVGAAAGYGMAGGLRVEGEAFYTTNEIEDLKVEGTTIPTDGVDIRLMHMAAFINLLYDFQTGGAMGGAAPYVGGGVGYGSTSVDIDNESEHSEGAIWQFKAGVAFPVNENLMIDVGYRYIHGADFKASGSFEDYDIDLDLEPKYHALTIGARMAFGGGAQ